MARRKQDLQMASGSCGKVVQLCKGGPNSSPASVELVVQASNSPADLLCLALCEGSQHGSYLLYKLCLQPTQQFMVTHGKARG